MSGFRRNIPKYLRFVFRLLPIPEQGKRKLKDKYFAWTNDQRTMPKIHTTNTAILPSTINNKKVMITRIVDLFSCEYGRPENIVNQPLLYNDSDSPQLDLYSGYDEYMDKKDNREYNRRLHSEFESSLLADGEKSFAVSGYCSICDHSRQFSVDYLYAYERNSAGRLIPNWRESLVCEKCKMNNRVRAAVDLLRNQITIKSEGLIYTTEQLTPFFQWLKDEYPNVIGSEFLGGNSVSGRIYDKIRHEDITDLSFNDNSLDCVLSFDVLEHVPDVQKSLLEFIRCLKPGGFALISAPFAANEGETIVRARISKDGSIEHLLEPEYHGNPTKPDEGSLCFYHFGWDLLDQLRTAGARDAAVISYYSAERANIGNEQLFFLALK